MREGQGHAGAAGAFDKATSGPGQSVPYQGEMEQAFGQDFSSVSAHTGASSEMSALGANAAAKGESVAFAASAPTKETVAHELTHVVQARQAGGGSIMGEGGVSSPSHPAEREASQVASAVAQGEAAPAISAAPSSGAVHRDSGVDADQDEDEVPEVDEGEVERSLEGLDDLLSYGAFDWAITDAEAWAALGILGSLEIQNLEATIAQMGQTRIDRLLENLPSSARRGAAFCKVLVAMGPSRVQPYLADLLETGFFDWAVTDAEIRAICRIVMSVSTDQRAGFIMELNVRQRELLLNQLPDALNDDIKGTLRVMFFATKDSDFAFASKVFEKRFGLTLSSAGDVDWDAVSLTRTWNVLETLPEGDVRGNPELLQWIRLEGQRGGGGGWYDGGEKLRSGDDNPDYRGVGMSFNPDVIDETLNHGGAEEGDPLYDVNRFDKVVRHEVGHAVDARGGYSDTYCATAGGGTWLEHGTTHSNIAYQMVQASPGFISGLPAEIQSRITSVIATAMSDQDTSTLVDDIEDVAGFAELDELVQTAVTTDPVITAVTKGLDTPWYSHAGGGQELGGRIFQESYDSSKKWVSYKQEARNRKVSLYQFRAPGEWFAEAYAAYYQPTEEDGTTDHSVLGGIDSTSKQWFDKNVAGS